MVPFIPFTGGGRGGLPIIMIVSAMWLLSVAGLVVPKRQEYIAGRLTQLTKALETLQGRTRQSQQPKRLRARGQRSGSRG
jgi:hypothetical protein